MSLPAMALMDRALRLEVRSLNMCWARMALPGMILVAMMSVSSMLSVAAFGAPGLRVFQPIMWINFSFATLAGLSYFASAITEEKEDMTLGLLRMTGLSPLAILFGKSTSRLVGAVLMAVVQLPFTLLSVALGGVTFLQILAAYGALLAYVFLICNLALFWSVVARQTSAAAALTGLTLGLLLMGPPFGMMILKEFGWLTGGAHPVATGLNGALSILAGASPFNALTITFMTAAPLAPVIFQIVANLVLGAVAFLLAWVLFEPCTRELKEAAPARAFSFSSLFRRGGRSFRVPAGVVGPKALTWKDRWVFEGGPWGRVMRIVLIGLLYAAIVFFPMLFQQRVTLVQAGASVMVASLLTLAALLAADASRVFREEVRWKTLASLMVLPMNVREIAYRKVAASLLGALPILGYFLVGVCLYPRGVSEFLTEVFRDWRGVMAALIFLSQCVLFLHLTAYLSLVVKRGALAWASAIQYFGFMLVMVLLSVGRMRSVTGLMLFGLVGTIVLTAILHRAIGRRLVRAASEE